MFNWKHSLYPPNEDLNMIFVFGYCPLVISISDMFFSIIFQAKCEKRLLELADKNIGDVSEFSSLLGQPGVNPNIHDKVRH